MKTTSTSAQATCRFDEDPEKSDGAGRDRIQALVSDPSAPMEPARRYIFDVRGSRKPDEHNVDVCCDVCADLSKTLKSRRCGPASKRQGREHRPLNERPVLFFSFEDLRAEILSSQYSFPVGTTSIAGPMTARKRPSQPMSSSSAPSNTRAARVHSFALAQESPSPHLRAWRWRRRVSTTGGTNPSRTSWSVEGWIHSKKRNRLGQKTVEQLVRSHTNQSAAGCWKRAQTTDSEESEKVLEWEEEMEIEEPDEGEEEEAC
eukprot:scaffold1228_cov115-Isochrysis_galbana.AAC.6